MTEREPVEAWILDDTGFLKQGSHSVGVQRQYTGSAGKVTNCQIGVSLSVATRTEYVPVDFELYLPESWTESPTRRKEAHIPDSILFQTKPQLGLAMVRRAIDDGLPRGVALADSGYGSSSELRKGLRDLGLDYAVGIDPKTTVSLVDANAHSRGDPVSVRDFALRIETRGGSAAAPGGKEPSKISLPDSPSGESFRLALLPNAMPSGFSSSGACQLLPLDLARDHHQAAAHPARHAAMADRDLPAMVRPSSQSS